jgi:hypothetical protein
MLDADEFLDNTEVSFESPTQPYIKIPGEVDYRLKQLSYSSNNLLNTCPRKYQLYKLRAGAAKESVVQTISNSYGHAIGYGTQLIFQDKYTLKEILWEVFLFYPIDLQLQDEQAKKSFWSALTSIIKLYHARKAGFLADWVIMEWEGKPAIEFSFCINLPNGFRFRGHVDAVMKHKKTGQIGVLERKSTKYKTVAPEMFKNSAQALGYSIVLDHLFPELSSYEVLYLVYSSTTMEEILFTFGKSYTQRAEWIQDLLFTCDIITMYDEAQIYPMRGQACFDYFRPCQYFQTCNLSIENLAKAFTPELHEDQLEYQVNISITELIETQLRKTA